jgi:hypothetical protein
LYHDPHAFEIAADQQTYEGSVFYHLLKHDAPDVFKKPPLNAIGDKLRAHGPDSGIIYKGGKDPYDKP